MEALNKKRGVRLVFRERHVFKNTHIEFSQALGVNKKKHIHNIWYAKYAEKGEHWIVKSHPNLDKYKSLYNLNSVDKILHIS